MSIAYVSCPEELTNIDCFWRILLLEKLSQRGLAALVPVFLFHLLFL